VLYKEIPFLRITLPLAAGIIAGSLTWNLPHVALLLCSFLATLAAYFISASSKNGLLPGILLLLFFFSAGYSLYKSAFNRIAGTYIDKGSYKLIISDYPLQKKSSLEIDALICKNDTLENIKRSRLLLYFPAEDKVKGLQPGDIITADLRPREIIDFNTSDSFDYRKYMLYRGYKFSAWVSDYSLTGQTHTNIRTRALRFRKLLLEKYESGLDSEQAMAVASALTLGYRDFLDEEVVSSFREAGISHIMAVSGLHVGIICLVLSWFTGIIRIRNSYARILIMLAGIWFFALVTGLSPSVCRAALMFTFLYTGKLSGRYVNPLNSLLASAFVLLLLNPFMLFAAGFQLSYSAVLFILLFYRPLNGLFNFSGVLLSGAWSLSTLSILAQLGTMPLVLAHFRQLPLLSLISNLFAIPLAFLILISGLLFLVIPANFVLADLLARLIEIEVYILSAVAGWIASLPYSVIRI
jgi:competence protein ComEC